MFKGRRWSLIIGAVCAALVLGGTVAVTTPAGAQLSINWNRIFKQEIKPRANKVYYKKGLANKKFAPKPKVIRGTYSASDSNGIAEAGPMLAAVSFGFTLAEVPTAHFIALGDPVPAGCSGTPEAPGAAAGNLCVFEVYSSNATDKGVALPNGAHGATAMGAVVHAWPDLDGAAAVAGTWAVRPTGFSNSVPAGPAPRPSGKVFGR